MKTANIVIVDDDTEYAGDVAAVLTRSSGFHCSGRFGNPLRFLDELREIEADVVLLDISMPGMSGIDCIGPIRRARPDCRVLMLTLHDDEDLLLKAFLEGADGYLLKESTPTEIRSAIREALNGGAPMSPRIARKVIRALNALSRPNAGEEVAGTPGLNEGGEWNPEVQRLLSAREFEVLRSLAAGKKYAEIAREMSISLSTVKTHINHIYEKLRVRNKAEAISRLLKG